MKPTTTTVPPVLLGGTTTHRQNRAHNEEHRIARSGWPPWQTVTATAGKATGEQRNIPSEEARDARFLHEGPENRTNERHTAKKKRQATDVCCCSVDRPHT
mmetsp:Transcript_12863/g.51579  ORF Transcript_12863/g.51579 Transcript_12863/m.51579 type:complete len:101 (-) Transcript_12863:103-405(-)